MSDISHEFIYIIYFVATLFIICVISSVFCGDPIYNKLKSCCKSNKVEHKHEESKVVEV
jgi:hypothetical protein